MNPQKLILRGFRGIKDGMGKDEFTLDLTQYHDAVLIALAGVNGKGKTTVLENLQPFPILPSRATGYSLAAFSMYDHIAGPEAVKDLFWLHEGKTYHSVNIWRVTGKKKSAEAYLFELDAQGVPTPYRTRDGVIADGKVDTFNQALCEILGTPDVYFASAFAAQNRRKLCDYKEAELKDLLTEFLNFGDIAETGERAAKVVSGLSTALKAMAPLLRVSEEAREGQPLALRTVEESRMALAQATEARERAQKTLADVKQSLATLQPDIAKRDLAIATKQALEAQRAQQEHTITQRAQLLAEVVQSIQAEATRDKTEQQARLSGLEKRLQAVQKATVERQALLAQREAIETAAVRAVEIETALAKAQQDSALARERVVARTEQDGAIKVLQEKLNNARTKFQTASAALERIRVQSKLCDEVPCIGSELQPRCKLLTDALAARAQANEQQASLDVMRNEGKALASSFSEKTEALAGAPDPKPALLAAEKVEAELRAALLAVQKMEALAPALAQALGSQQSADAELVTIERERAELDKAYSERQAERDARLLARRETPDELRDQALAAKAKIEADLNALVIPPVIEVAVLQARVAEQQAAVKRAEDAYAAAQSASAKAEAKLAAIDSSVAQAAPLREKVELLNVELSKWTLLAKALGRNGLIAMLIDEAGPTLASLANDILLASYGRRYSVSIVTQKTRANGEPVETFDILVHDAEAEEAKSLFMMSGGQRVWINDAITRAIALYCAMVGSHQYGALFGDEADGPLDAEAKEAYFRMQRKVAEMGKYEKVFLITQTPELLEQVDAVITFE
ncbi:MAG: hypothetical protein ING57_15705 [Rhodocyclaceae bacterium]|nr:hypothetical protein [Rhodocyclaceae bacterium]MCA3047764.1 hypothetical protein [Rhodocyclaceae bacterium]